MDLNFVAMAQLSRKKGGEIRGILDPFVIKIFVKYVGENRWCFSHGVHLGMPCFYAETRGPSRP